FVIRVFPLSDRSTLFPYTTLFRSIEGPSRPKYFSDRLFGDKQLVRLLFPYRAAIQPNVYYVPLTNVSQRDTGTGVGQVACHQKVDRKSTRLNSSHVKISYAVFCLQ